MKQNTYLVIDTDSNSVLYFAPSKLTANIVSRGLLNTMALEIPTAHPWREDVFKGIDKINDHIRLINKNGRPAVKFLELEKRTSAYIQKKELATLRGKYIYGLELFSMSNIIRVTDLLDESLLPFINQQLEKSNPETESFSPALQEYATLLGITPENAYYDLSMRAETAGLIRIRAQAIFEKYSTIINQSSEEADFFKALNDAYYDQLGKATV